MRTVLTQLFEDVGIDTSDEKAKYYLELEKLQIINAISDYYQDKHKEPADYYYQTYEQK